MSDISADRRPPTADRRPPTADRRPPTADRRLTAPASQPLADQRYVSTGLVGLCSQKVGAGSLVLRVRVLRYWIPLALVQRTVQAAKVFLGKAPGSLLVLVAQMVEQRIFGAVIHGDLRGHGSP
jgi:hypothetical protein